MWVDPTNERQEKKVYPSSNLRIHHIVKKEEQKRGKKNEPKKQFDTQCKRQTFAIFIKLFMFLYVHIFPFKFLHRIIFLFCVSSYINSNFLFFQLCLMCSVLLSFFPCCFFLVGILLILMMMFCETIASFIIDGLRG